MVGGWQIFIGGEYVARKLSDKAWAVISKATLGNSTLNMNSHEVIASPQKQNKKRHSQPMSNLLDWTSQT